MRRGVLVLVILASMVVAGCIGPAAPEWGKSSNAVHVNDNGDGTYTLTPFTTSDSRTVNSIGCDLDQDSNTSENNGTPFTFTGYLASSYLYDAHEPFDKDIAEEGLPTVLSRSTALAVAVQKMSFSNAENVPAGEGPRIDLNTWEDPISPDTKSGGVDLTKSELESKWYVLGLIPSSQNVLEGMIALTEWHQPVSISGFILPNNANKFEANSKCDLAFDGDKFSEYVLVEEIVLASGVISESGDDDEEWVHGDVAFIGGRAGYISSFLIFGIGGAVATFIFSKTLLLKDAKDQMKVLVGEEGMSKVAKVKADIKVAKKEGMESPEERLKRQRKDAEAKAKLEQRKSSTILPSEGDSDELGGFDLDSVLASAGKSSRTSGPGTQAPARKSSSSVVTSQLPSVGSSSAKEPPAKEPPARESASPSRSRGPPPSRTTVASEPEVVHDEPEVKRQPPVRRRKAVKKTSSPPWDEEKSEAEPQRRAPPQRQKFDDDEDDDFSDFSF